ncbi:16500_t:CDS:1, partial [Dentiscutata erythropus]
VQENQQAQAKQINQPQPLVSQNQTKQINRPQPLASQNTSISAQYENLTNDLTNDMNPFFKDQLAAQNTTNGIDPFIVMLLSGPSFP